MLTKPDSLKFIFDKLYLIFVWLCREDDNSDVIADVSEDRNQPLWS